VVRVFLAGAGDTGFDINETCWFSLDFDGVCGWLDRLERTDGFLTFDCGLELLLPANLP